MKPTLLSAFFVLLITLHGEAEEYDLPQMRHKMADDPEITEETLRAGQIKTLEAIESRFKSHPDKKGQMEGKKFDVFFRGSFNSYTVEYSTPIFQAFQWKVINEHPEWVPLILDLCRIDYFKLLQSDVDDDIRTRYLRALEMLPHHQGCTWEKSRKVYRSLLEKYNLMRNYILLLDKNIRYRYLHPDPDWNPGASYEETHLRHLIQLLPGVLARFPTDGSIEALCQQLESYPGRDTLAAANALSVCTSEATAPRVRLAFAAARRIRLEINPGESRMPLEYLRLERRLTDLKADLSEMLEGAGFRLIQPDWNAAKDTTWTLQPAFSTEAPSPSLSKTLAPAHAPAPPLRWYGLLLLLAPASWWAGRAWERHHARAA